MNDGADPDALGSPDDDGDAQTRAVAAPDLQRLRSHVRDTARRVGLDPDGADRFTIAVNEVVINAIQHAGGTATVTVASDGEITVTVTDRGPGLDTVPARLPPSDQTHGRGLWLAHRLCDDITIRSTASGTRIRLRARPEPAGSASG